MSIPFAERAIRLLCAAADEARAGGDGLAIAIVDQAGTLVAAHRMEGVSPALIGIAQRKAATSAAFGLSLATLTEMMTSDPIIHQAINTSPDLLLLPGAAPIMDQSVCVGAIGVSGGHYSQDQSFVDRIVASDC